MEFEGLAEQQVIEATSDSSFIPNSTAEDDHTSIEGGMPELEELL